MLRVPSQINSGQFESLKIQDMTFVAYRNEVYPSRYEVFFEEHAIIYVLEGEKKFISPDQEVHVCKGDVLFVQRGFYLMSESINDAYKSLVFFFDEQLLNEFVSLHRSLFDTVSFDQLLPTQPILSFHAQAPFERFVDSIFPYFRHQSPLKTHFLRLKFQELLLHLLEADPHFLLRQSLFTLFQNPKADLDFLMNSYALKPLTLNELARLSGRSLSAFKRDFFVLFRTSPAFWLKQKRLAYAHLLLETSAKTVAEVSMEIGYESVSHFIRAFKEKYGVTPKKMS
jgi:AraC-like DNA-binding protein